VTVCIAAIADSEHIVTVNDMQLTAGGYYSAPMGSLKSFPIHPKWRVLIAGKISQKAPILGYLKETLPADESLTGAQVAKACTDAFVQTTRQFAEEKVLSKYSLTMETFLKSRDMLGDVYRELWGEIGRIQMGIEMLVFGFDEASIPTLFTVSNPTDDHPSFVTYGDDMGFGCIGTGAFLAESTLYGFEQGLGGVDNLSNTIYHVACAKFAAEAASDVGELTYLRVYKPDGTVFRFDLGWIETKLRPLWLKHCKPREDHEIKETISAKLEGLNKPKLSRQVLKGERWGCNHMTQSIQEESGRLTAVEAELHLGKVRREMFRADLVPRSHDATLEQGECRFHGVSVNVSSNAHIFFARMIDCLMLHLANRAVIGGQFVGDNYLDIGTDVLFDVLCQRSLACILSMKEAHVSTALPDSDYHFFVGSGLAASGVTLLSAYVGFVHFDSTFEHSALGFGHGCADTMTEIPRGFVGAFVLAPNRSPDLVSRDSFAGFTKQQGHHEPFSERQVRVMEDRTYSDGELVIAVFAIQESRIQTSKGLGVATWTLGTIGPAKPFKQFAAFLVGVKQFNYVRESHREHPV
jgi:hypothetical protein